MQDVSLEYPDEIIDFEFYNGHYPEDMDYEPEVYCVWQGRCFIHARATLPIKETEHGIGFGLWVELSPEDFEHYTQALEDDKAYETFTTTGTLASEWPGFEGILGSEVTVKTLHMNEKVYITDVQIEKTDDPLFYTALHASAEDAETKKQVKDLVNAYLADQDM